MEQKTKNAVAIIVLIFIIVATMVTIFMPGGMGLIAVAKKMVTFCSIAIVCAVLLLLSVKGKNLQGTARMVCAVMGAIGVLVGGIVLFNGTRGIIAGVQTVETAEYEFGSSSTRGIRSYYIKTRINGELTRIFVDDEIFREFCNSSGTLSVAYYPYINIADDISVK